MREILKSRVEETSLNLAEYYKLVKQLDEFPLSNLTVGGLRFVLEAPPDEGIDKFFKFFTKDRNEKLQRIIESTDNLEDEQ